MEDQRYNNRYFNECAWRRQW